MAKDPVPDPPDAQVVKFDYIKSPQFRTARGDGVWGGMNGHLDIVMAFFSERPAIPQQITHTIEGEQLGPELHGKRISRDSIVREVEICISMNVEVAKSFRRWLDDKIQAIEEIAQKRKPVKGD